MAAQPLGFFARLALAWRILLSGVLAGRLKAAAEAPAQLEPPAAPAPPPQALGPKEPTSALQLLSLLQREGRLVDFLREDVAGFTDAEVGGAARVVHEGCRKVLDTYFVLKPVRSEEEGASVTLERGFDAQRHRLTGNVTGEPPYRGSLAHAGWEVSEARLPTLSDGHDAHIVAPAEVEL